jgi:hypothetical protein
MKCLGRTKSLLRCRRQTARWFCPSHRWQPLLVLFTLVSVGLKLRGYYHDTIRPYFIHKSPSQESVSKLPCIALTFKNTSKHGIEVASSGEIAIWLPSGLGPIRQIPGRFDLSGDSVNSAKGSVTVLPGEAVQLSASIASEIDTPALLSKGVGNLEFILQLNPGGTFFSGEIPFKADKLATKRWMIDLAMGDKLSRENSSWEKTNTILTSLATYRNVKSNETGFVRGTQFLTLLKSIEFPMDPEFLAARDTVIRLIDEAPKEKTGLPEDLELTVEIISALDRLFILAEMRAIDQNQE